MSKLAPVYVTYGSEKKNLNAKKYLDSGNMHVS